MTDIKLVIEIKVSGPGQTFGYEFELIKKTLESAGYVVRVENDYPLTEEEFQKLSERFNSLGNPKTEKTEIKMVARHIPWGG